MSYEREYCEAALEAVRPWLYLLPTDVQRKVRLAQSVLDSYGSATAEEIRNELGANWVIARRTRRIVEKYGADVKCYTNSQYKAAERRAIESRY